MNWRQKESESNKQEIKRELQQISTKSVIKRGCREWVRGGWAVNGGTERTQEEECWSVSLWPSSLICLLSSQPHLMLNTGNVITASRGINSMTGCFTCMCVCTLCAKDRIYDAHIDILFGRDTPQESTTRHWRGQADQTHTVPLKVSVWMFRRYARQEMC